MSTSTYKPPVFASDLLTGEAGATADVLVDQLLTKSYIDIVDADDPVAAYETVVDNPDAVTHLLEDAEAGVALAAVGLELWTRTKPEQSAFTVAVDKYTSLLALKLNHDQAEAVASGADVQTYENETAEQIIESHLHILSLEQELRLDASVPERLKRRIANNKIAYFAVLAASGAAGFKAAEELYKITTEVEHHAVLLGIGGTFTAAAVRQLLHGGIEEAIDSTKEEADVVVSSEEATTRSMTLRIHKKRDELTIELSKIMNQHVGDSAFNPGFIVKMLAPLTASLLTDYITEHKLKIGRNAAGIGVMGVSSIIFGETGGSEFTDTLMRR